MSTAAKVGAFFLVALVLTGLLIWRIEDLKFGPETKSTVSVEFSNVAGLKEKADVRLAGVLVGKVKDIRLLGSKAIVDLDLAKGVSLRNGASASIQSVGMLGDKYVELLPGPPGAPPLPVGSTLPGEVPIGFDEITKLARDIEVDISDITKNVKESFGGPLGKERVQTIVDDVMVLSRELRKLVESNRANVDATTANFREFSTQMTALVQRIDRLVASNQTNVTDTVASAKDLSAKMKTTVDNMNAITQRIQSGQGTIGKLVESDQTEKNLNEALVAVKEGVNNLTDAMTTVKKWNFDLGLRAEYLTRFSKGQSFFTLDLQRVGTPRFYRLELSSQPFGVQKDTTFITTTTFPDGHTETTRTEQTEFKDTVAISAEVGWRLGHWIGRAGLIENKGGVGIDFLTLKDRLQFSAQFWNFDRDALNAQAKITTRYYFSPSVYVLGGWNDFLNTKAHLDSAFIGAGIRWGDNDMKYLAGSIPTH